MTDADNDGFTVNQSRLENFFRRVCTMSFDAMSVEVTIKETKKIPESVWMAMVAKLPMLWYRCNMQEKKITSIVGNNSLKYANQFELWGDFPVELLNNIGMVYSVLRKLVGDSRPRIEKYDELLQEGLVALCKAYVLFDKSKNCEFSTFAFTLIRQGMRNALRFKNSPIYILGNGENTIAELCKAKMNKGKKDKTRYLNSIRYNPETIQLSWLRREGWESLDSVPPKGTMVFIRFEESEKFELLKAPQLEELGDSWNSKCEASIKENQTRMIQRVMQGMTEREKLVLSYHKQGYTDVQITGMIPLTEREIAKGRTALSKAAIGQIRAKAVARLDEILATPDLIENVI
jgi:RNA polymerase sigma factor (sigma-70 family)